MKLQNATHNRLIKRENNSEVHKVKVVLMLGDGVSESTKSPRYYIKSGDWKVEGKWELEEEELLLQ